MNRQFHSDTIDQLDLALEQLSFKDRNHDRFALMLIDNVVELVLHRFAQEKFRESKSWGWLTKEDLDSALLERALGQKFDHKVKFAKRAGLITEDTCNSILSMHKFRNTAYHKGMRHEGILHSITKFYFSVTCNILIKLSKGSLSWMNNDVISQRAQKYIGKPTIHVDQETFTAAYRLLAEKVEIFGDSLLADLSKEMGKIIHNADRDIDFLARRTKNKQSRDKAIIDAQAWHFAFTEPAKTFVRAQNYEFSSVETYLNWLIETYNWPIKCDPIPSWRERLQKLNKAVDLHAALKMFNDFLLQSESILALIDESAIKLDHYIQLQIDLARGK